MFSGIRGHYTCCFDCLGSDSEIAREYGGGIHRKRGDQDLGLREVSIPPRSRRDSFMYVITKKQILVLKKPKTDI